MSFTSGILIPLLAAIVGIAGALLGLWLTGLLISAMLRFRARSVFHSDADAPIARPAE